MDGLLTISLSKVLMILRRVISAEQVSLRLLTILDFCCYRMLLNLTPVVPKFQGENFFRNKSIVEEIKKLAVRKGCTLPQIALAWVAAQGMIAIPGTTKVRRLEENWASRDIDLTEEEKQEMRTIIDAAKPHGNRYSERAQAMVGH
jgi:diketogulonate reductase-like aldo/keto reductase